MTTLYQCLPPDGSSQALHQVSVDEGAAEYA